MKVSLNYGKIAVGWSYDSERQRWFNEAGDADDDDSPLPMALLYFMTRCSADIDIIAEDED